MSVKGKGKQSTPLPSLLNSIRNVVNSNSNTTSQHHNHQEVRPLISPSNDSHSHNNTVNNNNNNNNNIIKGYLDRFHITSVSEIGKPRRTIKSIGFRTRDKRDVSGKKEFRVHVPARILVYTIVIFLILPLILGFGLLIRLVFRHHFEESGQSGHHLRKDDFTNIIGSEDVTFEDDDKTMSILDMNNTLQKEDEENKLLSKNILHDQEFNNTALPSVTNNEIDDNQSMADDYHRDNILSDNENVIHNDGNNTSKQQEQQNQEDSKNFQKDSAADDDVKDSPIEYYENASLHNRTEIISGP